ncbi:MAG: 5'/3'-nucleotidase SurE [Spirochaetales bacterium]|uniref:5'-nucleotidase n=1 Tax=Candidatus Thalassospirochaeta sargassi TaxID=3119039 RepID=A0AAJ1MLZ5_9SPIO|nr:5'/3'-nucleotidase SurE [Spirochaetales bacterium]
MSEAPLILLTNDDGILSPGLISAAEELRKLGELWVAAPAVQHTSAGRSHPLGSTGIIRTAEGIGRDVKAFSVEASPAQCVNYAVLELLPRLPDLIVSGINSGVNVGVDITRSGTIGAALEAANYGIRSLAVSLEIHMDEVFAAVPKADFCPAARITAEFAKKLLSMESGQDVDIIKVEVPDSADEKTPWETARLSRTPFYHLDKPERKTPGGPGQLSWRMEKDYRVFDDGTDAHTVFVKRHVAVTPISLDMTSRIRLENVKKLLRKN